MSFISMRLGDFQHKDEASFTKALELFERHPAVVDDIWFSSDYGFPDLETIEKNSRAMAAAAKRARDAGIGASLQISNTIGHGDYNRACSFNGIHWQKTVGHDGVVTDYGNCPRDPDFLDYIRRSTQRYASWRPDAVWIDDDLRMNSHHPADWACFCPRCIAGFSARTGREWERGELVRAINDPDDASVRQAWTEYNCDGLLSLMAAIVEAVQSVSPETRIGLQHATPEWVSYSGFDFFPKVASLVQRMTGRKMLSRPGGGYYTDHAPMGMVDKALGINFSIGRFGDTVEDFRPEIESFHHTIFNKTPRGLAVESTLDLAYGCNALSYAIMMMGNEEPDAFEDIFRCFDRWLPLWKEYVDHNRDARPAGVGVWYGDQCRRMLEKGEAPFQWAGIQFGGLNLLAATGLPMTYELGHAGAVLLHESMAENISAAELRQLLTGGVIMSGGALAALNRRGFGEMTCVAAEPMEEADCCEQMTEDPLNGGFAGRPWMMTSIAENSRSYRLTPASASARVIGRYLHRRTQRSDGAGPSAVLTPTPYGGRLAVFGYYPWEPVVNTAKWHQLLAVADWASAGRMPALSKTPARAVIIPRTEASGLLRSVAVLNPSIDDLSKLTLALCNPGGEHAVWAVPGKKTPVGLNQTPEGFLVDIPPMAPWEIGILYLV